MGTQSKCRLTKNATTLKHTVSFIWVKLEIRNTWRSRALVIGLIISAALGPVAERNALIWLYTNASSGVGLQGGKVSKYTATYYCVGLRFIFRNPKNANAEITNSLIKIVPNSICITICEKPHKKLIWRASNLSF